MKWFWALLTVLLINSAYISAVHPATVFYMGNVLLHLVLGLALSVAAIILLRRKPALLLLIVSSAFGLYLAVAGNTSDHRWILWSHIFAAVLAAVVIAAYSKHRALYASFLGLLLLGAAMPHLYRRLHPNPSDRIHNPLVAPVSMNGEGAGPRGPFFPSSIQSNTGKLIPADFFMDSKSCGECHKEIYKEWNSSAHHFASFNNQFYRKSIEYMQDVSGTQSSKWCAGCHDHALLLNGRWERPVREQIDTPEAQNGLGCMSCHSITKVDSSMGNAGFTMEYPPLHELANSKNPYLHKLNHFLTYLSPEPHRRTFLKPFMREDAPEFCSSCHKVHLDVPVNNYRWVRGFNDYDNWQASGVSGQGARSFYYPKKSSTCSDCHMPMVPSHEPGSHNGKLHSHRFAAANIALAAVNEDLEQRTATEAFLKSGFMSVDIFAISPVAGRSGDAEMVRRKPDTPQAMSSFAVGEEAEHAGPAVLREVGDLAAPIDHAGAKLTPGQTARVDVVVRTRKIGHFFPGGTVDAFDVWLELEGCDATGRPVFWSGRVEDNGKGPVEPGAHFYKSYQLDGDGNPINKRNAFQMRSVLYVHLIPPGAADVAHFRVKVPSDAKGPITFTAKLNYRKFSHFYTQYSYAGKPEPNQNPGLLDINHNGLKYSFLPQDIPQNVSGKVKDRIPDLPITVIARATATVPLGKPEWKPLAGPADRERWNDYGIGLLLQGDLKAAEYAFRKVTEADPKYADGWLNMARALIQEGETDAAKPFIAKALALDAGLARIYYFRALIEKADGDYDAALRSLRVAESKYPRDRVVLNQIGRILFLQRKYKDALVALDHVSRVDPEDLQMHYTRMLCYRGLGDQASAGREEALFRRFKADESSQTLTARARLLSPEDNNERQTIHDHESVDLR
ncbi:MAG: tetratricopeptide repeat protein [Bryobacteraceae bacterium]